MIFSDYFSQMTGNKVYFKPENMQRTGAYKLRGAYYKISTLTEEERAKGLITASAGNHAQGVAYAAKAYGAKAVIVMPTTTPLIKVERTKSYGAEVVLYGDVYDDACAHAYELAEEHGYTFIHPFDDPAVATGQGTIAMEIIKELPLVDYILVPIGGGGLATGVSTLAKLLKPNIKVIGTVKPWSNFILLHKVKSKSWVMTEWAMWAAKSGAPSMSGTGRGPQPSSQVSKCAAVPKAKVGINSKLKLLAWSLYTKNTTSGLLSWCHCLENS